MPAADRSAAELFGLVRLLAIAVTWSRFAGGLTLPYLDGPLIAVLAAAFWVCSTLAFVGVHGRLFTLLTGLTCFAVYYTQGVYGEAAGLNSHHVFAQSLLTCLVALLPCDRALALRPSDGPVPLWGQDLFRLQLTVLYAGGVYEKSYPAWLDGTRLEQILYTVYLGSDEVQLGAVAPLLSLAAALVWAAELFLAIAVWFPRLTVPMLATAALLHLPIYLATPVGTFTATMGVFFLAVVPVDRFAAVRQGGSAARPLAPWVFAPLALGPVLGLMGYGPAIRGFDGAALQACDQVEISDGHGRRVPLPSTAHHHSRDGLQRALNRSCRRRPDARVIARCASDEGWEQVELSDCGAPVPSQRRIAW